MSKSSDSLPEIRPTAGAHRPLGRNDGGYRGETIHLGAVLHDCARAAERHGWNSEELHSEPRRIVAFTRPARVPGGPRARVYLSTGIHGDEPAGPLAMLDLLQADPWPPGFELRLVPCLNPSGFDLNRRENAEGLDLNRQYRQPRAAEVVAHTLWLQRQPPFDLCLCLHEDWEAKGFYLYELNPDQGRSLARTIIDHVTQVCPIDPSPTIEGRPAERGVICPRFEPESRPDWPEAFFLGVHKTRLSYTLEAPSDFPLGARVAALRTAVCAALECFEPAKALRG